jgi:hypothetical protein
LQEITQRYLEDHQKMKERPVSVVARKRTAFSASLVCGLSFPLDVFDLINFEQFVLIYGLGPHVNV